MLTLALAALAILAAAALGLVLWAGPEIDRIEAERRNRRSE